MCAVDEGPDDGAQEEVEKEKEKEKEQEGKKECPRRHEALSASASAPGRDVRGLYKNRSWHPTKESKNVEKQNTVDYDKVLTSVLSARSRFMKLEYIREFPQEAEQGAHFQFRQVIEALSILASPTSTSSRDAQKDEILTSLIEEGLELLQNPWEIRELWEMAAKRHAANPASNGTVGPAPPSWGLPPSVPGTPWLNPLRAAALSPGALQAIDDALMRGEAGVLDVLDAAHGGPGQTSTRCVLAARGLASAMKTFDEVMSTLGTFNTRDCLDCRAPGGSSKEEALPGGGGSCDDTLMGLRRRTGNIFLAILLTPQVAQAWKPSDLAGNSCTPESSHRLKRLHEAEETKDQATTTELVANH